MQLVKVTSPFYLGAIGPFLKSYLDKVRMPGVTYESLYYYLASSVQSGNALTAQGVRNTTEFWVVQGDDGQPIACAHWFVQGAPFIGTVFCDHAHSWNTAKVPMGMLVDEFIRFGKDHRCKLYRYNAVNERVYQVFKGALEERSMAVDRTDHIFSYAVEVER